MAIQIKFDDDYNALAPTFVLSTKTCDRIEAIPCELVTFNEQLNSYSSFSFSVYKYNNGVEYKYWDKLKDFKYVWCKEWDIWFEIYVETDETNELEKKVTATSVAEAELSQVMIYTTEINTEDDIDRTGVRSPLYDPNNPETSLLHRIMDKVPNYRIAHVDSSIKDLKKVFTFDNISLYDTFQEISEEMDCLFILGSNSDENGNIDRSVSVYDLESNCLDCGYRGEFTGSCPECGSENVTYGYGKDTTIFVSVDNLADEITYKTDTDSVKNCFKLVAGDDLMTATVINCNPNGTSYLWYISDNVKEDMPTELVEKIEEYDELYAYYYNEYESKIDSKILDAYNALVEKYSVYNEDLQKVSSPIVGYINLMQALYETYDFSVYLSDGLMPTVSMSDTSAEEQASLLTAGNFGNVAVQDLSVASSSTVNSAVLAMAKVIVDSRYQVKINEDNNLPSYSNYIWRGCFDITNYSDEEDTATSSVISITITDDYEQYVRDKLDKALNNDSEYVAGIVDIFKLDYDDFVLEIKKYCLNSLNIFYDSCQGCIDVLIEQGIADNETWANGDTVNLYEELYMPYYNKLLAISEEMALREEEIAIIEGKYDEDDILIQEGLQTEIIEERNNIQEALDFESFIGEDLWFQFLPYRRESTYSNDNYFSEGLNNAELFDRALEFIDVAQKEIYKSAMLQHSITASLKNLLVMEEFKPIIDNFETGNWIRIKVDNKIYRLRLIEYTIDFDDLDSLDITFSDVTEVVDGATDVKSILDQATTMATSYGNTQRQASLGAESNSVVSGWEANGFLVENISLMSDAENQTMQWDSNGMLFRKYDDIEDDYEAEQVKIINTTIAFTNDYWESVKTAIGYYYYIDPETSQVKSAYGVLADTIVGRLIIGEQLGIYSNDLSLTFDENGLIVKNGTTCVSINPNNTNIFSIYNYSDDTADVIDSYVMYVDTEGNGHFDGIIESTEGHIGNWVIDEYGLRTESKNPSFEILSNGKIVASKDDDNGVHYEYTFSSEGLYLGSSTDYQDTYTVIESSGLVIYYPMGELVLRGTPQTCYLQVAQIYASDSSGLNILDKTTINGTTTIYGSLVVGSSSETHTSTLNGTTNINGAFTVGSSSSTRTSTLNGTTNINGSTSIDGTLTVGSNGNTHQTTLHGALEATGTVTFDEVLEHEYGTNALPLYITTNGNLASLSKNSSSLRYKHDIQLISDVLNKSNVSESNESENILDPKRLLDVNVVQYVYNDDYLVADDPLQCKTVIGFIAEDIAEKYPVATRYFKGQIEDWNERYIIPPMLKLIQDLYEEVDELKEQIEQIDTLKEEIKNLKLQK